MREHIDVNLSDLLSMETTLEEAADRVIQKMACCIAGRLTAAEVLGHNEFVLTRLHRSA
jgi:(2R)-sulfolactate sulfo-lyase subunit beta